MSHKTRISNLFMLQCILGNFECHSIIEWHIECQLSKCMHTCSWWTVLYRCTALHSSETLVYFIGGLSERAREWLFSQLSCLCHLRPITLDSISVWSCFPLLCSSLFESVWGHSVVLYYMLVCSILATSDLALIMLMTLWCGHCMMSLCALWVEALCGSGHFKRAIFVYRCLCDCSSAVSHIIAIYK